MNPERQSSSSDITPGFGGLRVVAFESRMAAEVATMIERRGGVAVVAPAMREVPLEDNHAALDFAERLLGGEFDAVIRGTRGARRARHDRPGLSMDAAGRSRAAARGLEFDRSWRGRCRDFHQLEPGHQRDPAR
jgi:uroporphyrinogen-III synthase